MAFDTSDSCDVDGDEDGQYREMREILQAFYHDVNRVSYKTNPVPDARLRKDIRAWARIARFRCIKLPCSSMLISKERLRLPQRQRKHQQPRREQDGVGWAFQNVSFDQHNRHTSVDQHMGCKGWQDQAYEQHRLPQSDWEAHGSNYDYQSGDSSASWSSTSSADVRGKKRRMPRNEGGYTCDFLGCERAYNRKCDLSHHQRSHKPKSEQPYACEHCDERYGFPKDLRRHEKKHQSKSSATSEDL